MTKQDKNLDYVEQAENVEITEQEIAVKRNVDIQALKSAAVKQSQIRAGGGVKIQGGSISISGGSIIAGGGINLNGGSISIDGATITSSGDLNIQAEDVEISNQVNLAADKLGINSTNLNLTQNSTLDITANEYLEEVEHKNLASGAEIKHHKPKE